MPQFTYTARNLSGQNVAGTISAATRRDALATLTEQSLFPLRVETARSWQELWSLNRPGRRRISTALLATNLSQLADLLQNGVPLLGALEVLAEQATHPHLAEVFTDVRNQVAEGMSLDQALMRHPQIFHDLVISMVRAGSEGAFLEDALKRTADFLELQEELKGRMVSAMAYPAFLAVAGFCVTVILIVFFVPKFAELFARLEQSGGLPQATVALLWLSDVLGRYGVLLVAGAGAAGLAAGRLAHRPAVRQTMDRWRLRLPVAGPIFLGFAVSRFCRVLGTLLRNGVPLLRSLEISSASAGNSLLAQAIRDSAENISSGDTLSRPLASCGLIPRPVMAMITVAEESNNLEEVLITIADGIDQQNGRRLDIMVRLVEPLMLLIMGGIILFVLVALLLPVFEMSATMG